MKKYLFTALLITLALVIGLYTYLYQTSSISAKGYISIGLQKTQNPSIPAGGAGALLEDFETTGDWSLIYGDSLEADTVNFKEGTQSIKANSVNAGATAIQKTVSYDLSSVNNLLFWVYVDNVTKLDHIYLYLASEADFSKYFYVYQNPAYLQTGWNKLSFIQSDFSVVGGESWSNTIIRLRFRCGATAGDDASCSFDDFRRDSSYGAKVIISFDDGLEGQYDYAYPILSGNGQEGTIFATTDWVDSGGSVTTAELTTMYDAGWDISSHTVSHPNLTSVNATVLASELQDSYDWLISNNFSRAAKLFAYPYGAYNDTVIAAVDNIYVMARTVDWQYTKAHIELDGSAEYRLTMRNVTAATANTTVKGWIDENITRDSYLILLFHDIVDTGAAGSEWNDEDFQEVSDYLKTKQDGALLEVLTFYEYYLFLYGLDISSTPTTFDFGVLGEGASANTGLNHYTITNSSGSSINITIRATDMMGGNTWTCSDNGSGGNMIVGFKAGLNGTSYNVTVKKSAPYNLLVGNFTENTTQAWGLQIFAPSTFTDGVGKSGNITITAALE